MGLFVILENTDIQPRDTEIETGPRQVVKHS